MMPPASANDTCLREQQNPNHQNSGEQSVFHDNHLQHWSSPPNLEFADTPTNAGELPHRIALKLHE
jgi:hypothetical protein